MEDIEDLVADVDLFDQNLRLQRNDIVPKLRRRIKISTEKNEKNNGGCCGGDAAGSQCCKVSKKDKCSEEGSCSNDLNVENTEITSASNEKSSVVIDSLLKKISDQFSNAPGKAKIFVQTWGCAHNSSDSEYMAGQLGSYGYEITEKKMEADLWLLNSCTVKSPAEHHLMNEIKAAQKEDKKLVIAGCVSQGAPNTEFLSGLSIVGVQQIDRVIEVVEETLKGNSVRLLGTKKDGKRKLGGASLRLPKIRRNPLIEIISINTGCLNQCTYCKTKHARGNLGSYSIEELVDRATQSFKEGVVEIWLTSEDTGAYGRDIGVTLPQLLYQLVEVIPEGCKLRLGMTNPPYILDHLEDMAKILNHPRVYKFLHVPVQSGSDSVLWDMKREYSREEFCKVVDTLREKVPGITIATDIICGYPTESEEDFQETMSLCKKYCFPSLFINQYFPRPGTPAARLPRIDPKKVKLRTKELSDFFQSYSTYDHKNDERYSILVTEESHDKQHWVGHNDTYDQVLVPKDENLLGKTVEVKIIETGKHFLKGEILGKVEELMSPAIAKTLQQGKVSGIEKDEKSSLKHQERVIIFSFVLIISALLAKLFWLFQINFNK